MHILLIENGSLPSGFWHGYTAPGRSMTKKIIGAGLGARPAVSAT